MKLNKKKLSIFVQDTTFFCIKNEKQKKNTLRPRGSKHGQERDGGAVPETERVKMKSIPVVLMGCGGVGRQLLQHIVTCRSLHANQVKVKPSTFYSFLSSFPSGSFVFL